jgi:hypothetical protein
MLARIYETVVEDYSDRSPEGSTIVVLQYTRALCKAMIDRDVKRFQHVYRLGTFWKAKGWMAVIPSTAGKTYEDVERKVYSYRAGKFSTFQE